MSKSSFVTALQSISSEKEMSQFLQEILTEAELRDIELRWKLMEKLRAGDTQRHIAQELGVSLCKVTRGNKILKNTNSISSRLLGASHE